MRQLTVLAGLLAAGSAAFGADQTLMNMVMPDAKVLAGVNVTTAKISPLGQFIIRQVQGPVTAMGFDPFTDVTEVLAASTADPANPAGLLLMDGKFNVGQIVTTLQSQANLQVQIDTQTYPGTTVITFTSSKAKITPAIAFVGTGTAVAGDAASVTAALARSGGANSITDTTLATRAKALSESDDAWMAGDAPIASLIPGNAGGNTGASNGMAVQALQMLKNIQSYSGALKFGDNVQGALQFEANSPQNAEALSNVVKLVVSLGGMNLAKDPQTAGLLQMLQALTVSNSGQDVDLALSIPESQVETLLKSVQGHEKTSNGN